MPNEMENNAFTNLGNSVWLLRIKGEGGKVGKTCILAIFMLLMNSYAGWSLIECVYMDS